ncbi:putative 39S ribosomal protein L40, mitochondrial-like [Apostichopus japonicus]|uniref:Large ribosomal subunit protein mL40 n=1 Tax=Stichopus japonicus TaxID=307972 RepID=A0A2G8LKI0_STIJA|nr:putative 39S ribosomal protein L40, mitochondrial-like [Apostichopus japonicus]
MRLDLRAFLSQASFFPPQVCFVPYIHSRGIFTGVGGLAFRASQSLQAEPPKKKKKTDPKQEQLRQHRYLKRLKKLQYKMGKAELKPVEEMRVDRALLDEARKRDLPEIPPEEQERRALLLKRWSKFKFAQHVTETRLIEGAIKAQEKALNELRTESEELYQQAIKTDNSLFPLEGVGPTHTPAIDGFDKKVIDGVCDVTDNTDEFL